MRLSRVVIGGASIAAVVAAGSAYTASNTLEADTVAGYAQTTVAGANVTNIRYNPDGTDPSLLASVVFTVAGNRADTAATMALKLAGVTDADGASTCSTGAHDGGTPGTTPITCTLGAPMPFADFDQLALTVVSQ